MGGMDLLEEAHPCYLGRFGPTGQRRANFTLQNADLLLCLGTSMSVSSAGFDTERLAPRAVRVMVNIDADEMAKPQFRADHRVVADLGAFLEALLAPPGPGVTPDARWIDATSRWKRDYPIVTADYFEDEDHVNSYVLSGRLSEVMLPGEVLLTGNGTDAVSAHHSFAVKKDQRVITNYGFGAMGWDLPAAVGACVARGGERTVLMTGDGSIQMNIQELLTVGHNHLDVKIFVLNNEGYESIRSTQTAFCDSRYVACDPESGVANPDFEHLAAAYGLGYRRFRTNADLSAGLAEVMDSDGPWLCEVNVSPTQEKAPRIKSRRRDDGTFESAPLDDQYPYLPREEREAIMSEFADPQR
jgi:acetolactate synthase-1/2/3 large subunit